uniref:flagellin lysine-N-methylase n=1 Tax=uncultured Clostridium sp. TaxID=59620 RepID=UPI002670D1B1
KLKGQWRNKINNNIGRIRSNISDLRYGKIKLKDKGCSLLDEKGLCTIHANLGVGYLCNTCKVYPREITKLGEIYERNLFMSCPEIARYFVRHKENFYFNMDEEELSDLDKDYIVDKSYDEKLYNLLWDSRSLAMEIIQFKEIEIWKRIIFLKILTDKVQKLIDEESYENYEKVLNTFRSEITNIDVINSLDKIKFVEDVKFDFIQSIINKSSQLKRVKYSQLINDYYEMFNATDDKKENLKLLFEKEREFNIFLKDYENILENLLIYLIYGYFMLALYSKDLNKQVNKVVITYSMIKMLLLGRWFKNNKKLEEEDFVEVIYVFSRVIEHNRSFLNKIYEGVKEVGYDKIAYITILVH